MVESTLQIPSPSNLPSAVGLPAILQLAARYPHVLAHHGQLQRADIVVDVNVIAGFLIGKVCYPAQKHGLEELVESGCLRLHIPHWAISELDQSTLSKVAERRGLLESALREQWQQHAHLFEVHERYAYPIRSKVPFGGDLDDEPYASLASDTNALGVLSHDPHIDDFGVARLSRDDSSTLRDYARYETASLSLRVGGLILTELTFHGIADLIAGLTTLWRSLPTAAQLAIIALAGYAVSNPSVRTHIIDALEAACRGAARGIRATYHFDAELRQEVDKRWLRMGAT